MPTLEIRGILAIALAFLVAFSITWYYIPKVITVVKQRHLEDRPGMHKIHRNDVPTLGGIGIFAGFLIGFFIGIDGYMPDLSYFAAAALFLFFVGIKDDLVHLHPLKKLAGQVGSALLIFFFTSVRFSHLHGFLGATDISLTTSFFVTIPVILIIINAFNLIDGIDGLASSVGIVATVTFGLYFYFSGDFAYTVMAASLLGSLIAFLRFNMSDGPNKIFMGDTGSLVIGFTMAVFAIRFNELDANRMSFINLKSAPSVSIAILIIPLFDTLRVIILRLYYHQSLLKADKRHLHHLMLRAGFSHRCATTIISFFNIFLIAVGYSLDSIGIFPLGMVLLSLCICATFILNRAVKRREAMVIQRPASSHTQEITVL
jgi:UDP-N-acetylmuramyl pentapeptide phosphotransferase/UDP-N-acetylglucosamine-1-phosphate transferase